MTELKTNAFAYNDAKRDMQKYQTVVTLADVKAFCEADPEAENGPKHNMYHSRCDELDLTPFYNDDVVQATMSQLELEDCDRTRKVISNLVYNTRSYNRAVQTVEKYHQMVADGYTPIHDTTPDMHGKKAQMVGESSGIMGTTKIDEKVTIVHDGQYQGYKKARQRTRYYVPAFDSQSFIKLI